MCYFDCCIDLIWDFFIGNISHNDIKLAYLFGKGDRGDTYREGEFIEVYLSNGGEYTNLEGFARKTSKSGMKIPEVRIQIIRRLEEREYKNVKEEEITDLVTI